MTSWSFVATFVLLMTGGIGLMLTIAVGLRRESSRRNGELQARLVNAAYVLPC